MSSKRAIPLPCRHGWTTTTNARGKGPSSITQWEENLRGELERALISGPTHFLGHWAQEPAWHPAELGCAAGLPIRRNTGVLHQEDSLLVRSKFVGLANSLVKIVPIKRFWLFELIFRSCD